jgi:hypothetical protein
LIAKGTVSAIRISQARNAAPSPARISRSTGAASLGVGRERRQFAARDRLEQLAHPEIVGPRAAAKDAAADPTLDFQAALAVERLAALVQRADPQFEPPGVAAARPFLGLFKQPCPDALPAPSLAQPNNGDEHVAAIAREMAGKGREVADNCAILRDRQENDAAAAVVEATQLGVRPLRPGMRLAGDAKELGLRVDPRRRRDQRGAVSRHRGPD